MMRLTVVGFADAGTSADLGVRGLELSSLTLADFDNMTPLKSAAVGRAPMFRAELDIGLTRPAAVRAAGTAKTMAVVLKQFQLRFESDLAVVKRELALTRRCKGPNVVNVLHVFSEKVGPSQSAFVVMPFFGGGNLQQWVEAEREKHAGLPPLLWTNVWRQLLAGLRCVHEAGIVHCDVKPQNVFVSSEGVVVLGDFDVSQDAAGRTVSLVTAALGGTLGFLAPELRTQPPVIGPASDMFAFGCTVRAVMLPEELKAAHSLDELVARCLSDDPSLRPTASEALRRCCGCACWNGCFDRC